MPLERGEGSSTVSTSRISGQLTTLLDKKIKDNRENFEALSYSNLALPRIPVIKRVPNMLREENEKAYTPSVLSIGPLHRRNKFLQTLEADKLSYMSSLFQRTGDVEKTRKECEAAMLTLRNTLRKCYPDHFKPDEIVITNLVQKMRNTLRTCYSDQAEPDEYVITDLVENMQNTLRTSYPDQVEPDENVITDLVENMQNSLRSCYPDQVKPDENNVITNFVEMVLKPLRTRYPDQIKPDKNVFTNLVKMMRNTLMNRDENVITNLLEMMLIDGCFIIELVYKHHTEKKDRILDDHFWNSAVRRDLLLLENQIPFVVLKELFSLTVQRISTSRNTQSSPPPTPTLIECLHSFFGDIMGLEYASGERGFKGEVPPLHILHLLHITYQPPPFPVEDGASSQDQPRGHQVTATQPDNNAAAATGGGVRAFCQEQPGGHHGTATQRLDNERVLLRATCCGFHCKLIGSRSPSEPLLQPAGYQGTATQLHNEEVKLRKRKKTVNMFDVEFKPHDSCLYFWRGRLEIPCFSVYHSTESFLRNFIAFEQCCPFVDTLFTSHAFLMDILMDSVEDVKLFEKAGVICNHLGTSESVLQMFHGICKNAAVPRHFHYDKQWRQMKCFRSPCRERLGTIKRNCAGNLWIVITVMGAIVLFVLTLLQTVYTMQS